MKKVEVDKGQLFEKYIVQYKTVEECADELNVSKATIRRRIEEYNFRGIRKIINSEWNQMRGYFFKEYIPDWHTKTFDEIRDIQIDYYYKTLVENLLYDRETKTFRSKTKDEVEYEALAKEYQEQQDRLAKFMVMVDKNPEKYPEQYKIFVEHAEKYHHKNCFDLKWIKECEDFQKKHSQDDKYFL